MKWNVALFRNDLQSVLNFELTEEALDSFLEELDVCDSEERPNIEIASRYTVDGLPHLLRVDDYENLEIQQFDVFSKKLNDNISKIVDTERKAIKDFLKTYIDSEFENHGLYLLDWGGGTVAFI